MCDDLNLNQACPNMSATIWHTNVVTMLWYEPCDLIAVSFVISRLRHTCWNNDVISSLIVPSSRLKAINSLLQTCYSNLVQAMRVQPFCILVTLPKRHTHFLSGKAIWSFQQSLNFTSQIPTHFLRTYAEIKLIIDTIFLWKPVIVQLANPINLICSTMYCKG